MENTWITHISDRLLQRRQENAYRERQAISRGNDRLIYYHGKSYINFSSNDYLGLARHPKVIEAWQKNAKIMGVGAAGSGHTIGYDIHHKQLEQRLADWLNYPRAILFTSGFVANQAVILTLVNSGDCIYADRLSHASLLEAAQHSSAELRRFSHNNPIALSRLLKRNCLGNRLVITEGVFSMDGDRAPLSILAHTTQTACGWLMVDDAHGIGVIGEEGRGCSWMLKVRPDILVITFGKAFGVSGAAVLCTSLMAEYLIQFSRHLIYSTALPPAHICAVEAALNIIQYGDGDVLRHKLQKNIFYFRHNAASIGFTLSSSETAIQPLVIGDNRRSLELVKRLRDRGIWLTAIRPPTVQPGSARLRITLTAVHQTRDIDMLLKVLLEVQQDI